MKHTDTILTALRYLAARCDGAEAKDGAGFNKPDSWLGKKLAGKVALSEDEVSQALSLLKKYAIGQLAEGGITLPEEEPARQEARVAEQASGKIDLDGDLLIVTFPYNPKLVEQVKAVKRSKWNGTAWTVPVAQGKDLLAALPHFEVSKAARKAIKGYVPPAVQYAGKISMDGDFLVIAFEYDPALVSKVKAIKGARFNGADKSWRVPYVEHKTALEKMTGFEIDPAIPLRIETEQIAAAAVAKAEAATSERLLKFFDGPLPSGRELFAHQRDGVRWLLEHRRAILADEMGLGKTTQALVAAKAYDLPVIVICPASLIINWQREAAGVGLEIAVYSWAKIPQEPAGEFVLIADEAHYAQSIKSARTKALLTLAKSDNCRGLYLLTGTPLKNGRPCNLYPLLAATKHPIALHKSEYEKRYCDAHETRWTKWDTSGASNLDELHSKTRDVILRRMKKDCLDLPEKLRVIRDVELSKKAEDEYNRRFEELRTEYKQRVKEGKISDISEALVMLNHIRHAGSIAKAETATELAQDSIEEGGQVVLFVAFKEAGEQIAAALDCKMLSGDTPGPERQAMVDAFQKGDNKALVCTFGAGGVGITLTAAQTVILVDRPWTPGDAEQAEDRLHRIGQRNAVTAIWLQHGEVDEAIDKLLQSKQERIELVLKGKRKSMRGVGSPGDFAAELLPLIME